MRRNERKVVNVLRCICGAGALLAVSCRMPKLFRKIKDKKSKNGMPCNEFSMWWQDTCEHTPNRIAQTGRIARSMVLCYYTTEVKTEIVCSIRFQYENLMIPYRFEVREGIPSNIKEPLNLQSKESHQVIFLTRVFFDGFKENFDKERQSLATPNFLEVFGSVYCDAMQNGKEELSEADKEKIRNDVIDFQEKMVADLQYISDEYDKLYERLFGNENDSQQK